MLFLYFKIFFYFDIQKVEKMVVQRLRTLPSPRFTVYHLATFALSVTDFVFSELLDLRRRLHDTPPLNASKQGQSFTQLSKLPLI